MPDMRKAERLLQKIRYVQNLFQDILKQRAYTRRYQIELVNNKIIFGDRFQICPPYLREEKRENDLPDFRYDSENKKCL